VGTRGLGERRPRGERDEVNGVGAGRVLAVSGGWWRSPPEGESVALPEKVNPSGGPGRAPCSCCAPGRRFQAPGRLGLVRRRSVPRPLVPNGCILNVSYSRQNRFSPQLGPLGRVSGNHPSRFPASVAGIRARVVESGRHSQLKTGRRAACGFESRLGHYCECVRLSRGPGRPLPSAHSFKKSVDIYQCRWLCVGRPRTGEALDKSCRFRLRSRVAPMRLVSGDDDVRHVRYYAMSLVHLDVD
jgi:hypothetical protein